MTEHELTEEKINELWEMVGREYLLTDLSDQGRWSYNAFARAAYDLGKQDANDDGFIPCEFEDIRKGDTVERTVTYEDGAVEVIIGEADYHDSNGDWYTRHSIELTDGFFHADATYRRKPAKVTPPDPEKHPIILDGNGDAWSWIGSLYQLIGEADGYRNPEDFDGNWTPAHVVAKEEAS